MVGGLEAVGIRAEVLPFIAFVLAAGVIGFVVLHILRAATRKTVSILAALALALIAFLLYFFRDPERTPPSDPTAILAGADGIIAGVTRLGTAEFARLCRVSGLRETELGKFRAGDVVRISIFLRLTDVHVNRAPISGTSFFLGYFPGRRLFTFQEKSSEENQHNSILITNDHTGCLVNQIVGPVCRRVVYWLPKDRPVAVKAGDRIGMMKFGSRLDMYLPAGDVTVHVRRGDRVYAGLTVVAQLTKEAHP
ncbi:MAG: phosphatidylserine decarboxylase [Kiritimatiellae bacterium]|nr:phosphatidylserine decarboxylase [Kiritimatiellia bacterium]